MLTAYMLTFVYNLYFTKPLSITQALHSDHLGLLKHSFMNSKHVKAFNIFG